MTNRRELFKILGGLPFLGLLAGSAESAPPKKLTLVDDTLTVTPQSPAAATRECRVGDMYFNSENICAAYWSGTEWRPIECV